jgi:hypothetical protein
MYRNSSSRLGTVSTSLPLIQEITSTTGIWVCYQVNDFRVILTQQWVCDYDTLVQEISEYTVNRGTRLFRPRYCRCMQGSFSDKVLVPSSCTLPGGMYECTIQRLELFSE